MSSEDNPQPTIQERFGALILARQTPAVPAPSLISPIPVPRQSPDTSGGSLRSSYSFAQPRQVVEPHGGRPSPLRCRRRRPNSTPGLQPQRESPLHRPRPLRLREFQLRFHTRPPGSAATTESG